ncbi:7467_t:CDS:1 [Paraglomus brasilianum]|uniref:7467_t:CDS:1 n=1 Tax=Paraglomus brasilianum TaxID=144538 RepID=A0A9N9CGH2_9GLOM|nr:7467_t:CDS:1 [Paraglomus brasilianum]
MATGTNANINTAIVTTAQSNVRFIGPHYLSVFPYYLSIPSPDDIQSLEYHLSDSNPDSESIHYWTLAIPRPYGIEDAEKFVNNCLDRTKKTGVCLQWAIRVQEERTGNNGNDLRPHDPVNSRFIPTLVGMIGVHLSSNDPKRYEIGYWLSLTHRNRGVVSSAVAKACEIVFEGLGEEEIYSQTLVGNLSSRKVLEKNAFEYLGVVESNSGDVADNDDNDNRSSTDIDATAATITTADIPITSPAKSIQHTWLFRKRK